MGRIRTVKPEFWLDEDLASLDPEVRLLALGLLNHSDDEGFFKAHSALVKAAIFPFTEHSVNIHGGLKQLSNVGYLRLFEGVDGKLYGEILNFKKHQRVNRPSDSKIKGLERFTEHSVNDHGELIAGTGNREQGTGKGKEEIVAVAPTPVAVSAPVSDYAFEGENFNVNQKDFQKHRELFPALDLFNEYQQIDLEVRDLPKRQRWGAINAKLNYRNKNIGTNQQNRNGSASNVQRQLDEIQAERESLQGERSGASFDYA